MLRALEQIPRAELELRHAKVRQLLEEFCPEASGLMAFSRFALYYLSGSWMNGALWLPKEGEPVLFCRRGLERGLLESSLTHVLPLPSYAQLPQKLAELEVPFQDCIAAEKNGLTWTLGELFRAKLPALRVLSGDTVLAFARAVKTPWELQKMRLAGARHDAALREGLPGRIHPGMTEWEISRIVWDVFFEYGHQGLMRMQNHGEEIFLGHVAAGDSGNYPSVFNGPLGLRGVHPALPAMGYAGQVWQQKSPLTLDCGFCLEGYHSDKTQVYWGRRSYVPEAAAQAQDFCCRVQEYLVAHLVPGALPEELYRQSLAMAGTVGLTEGFMGLGANKVNFLGHGIGLAVDEWPVLASGFTRPLEENMIFALEPKYGLSGVGMLGVENTFRVTPDGGESLTGTCFEPVFLE